MDTQRNTRWYDLFKLIVALILLALLLSFWLRPGTPPQVTGQGATGDPTDSSAVALASATLLPTVTQAPLATATRPSSATVPPPTTTTAPTVTTAPTKVPATPTATLAAVEATMATPEPTATPEPAAAEAATPTPAAEQAGCPQAQPSQLTVGAKARIMSNLNMRSAAGVSNSVIRTNAAGTVLEIISGPVCESAYLWWEVRLPDGSSGWSAEASANGSFYFLQPLP